MSQFLMVLSIESNILSEFFYPCEWYLRQTKKQKKIQSCSLKKLSCGEPTDSLWIKKNKFSGAILFEKWEICVRLAQRAIRFGRSWLATTTTTTTTTTPLLCANEMTNSIHTWKLQFQACIVLLWSVNVWIANRILKLHPWPTPIDCQTLASTLANQTVCSQNNSSLAPYRGIC